MPRGERSYHIEESQTERIPAVRLVTEITEKTEPKQIEFFKAHIRNLDKQLDIRKKMIEDATSEELGAKAKEKYERYSKEREELFAQLPQIDQIAFLQEEEQFENERNKIIQIDDFRKNEIKTREPKKRFDAKIGIESPAALAKEKKPIIMKKVRSLPDYFDLKNLPDNTYLEKNEIRELSPAIDDDDNEEIAEAPITEVTKIDVPLVDQTRIINPENKTGNFSSLPFGEQLKMLQQAINEGAKLDEVFRFVYLLNPETVRDNLTKIAPGYRGMLFKLLKEEAFHELASGRLSKKTAEKVTRLREIIIDYIPGEKVERINTGEFESLDDEGDQSAPYADTHVPNRPIETYNYELDSSVKEKYAKMSYDALVVEKSNLTDDLVILNKKIEGAKFVFNPIKKTMRSKATPDKNLPMLERQLHQKQSNLAEVEKNINNKKPQELKITENDVEANFFGQTDKKMSDRQTEEDLSLFIDGAEKTIANRPTQKIQQIPSGRNQENPNKQKGEKTVITDISKNPNIFIELQNQFQKNQDRSALRLFNDKVIEVEKEIERMQKQLRVSGMEKFKRFFGLGSIRQNEINEINYKIKLLNKMLAEAKTIRKNQFRD